MAVAADERCFSQDLEGVEPVVQPEKFLEFARCALSEASPALQENVAKLFSGGAVHSPAPSKGVEKSPLPAHNARDREEENARSWLSWASDEGNPLKQFIRCNEHAIPDGILPAVCSNARLLDFRVVPAKLSGAARRKGPPTDDAVYAEYKDLRDKVARGNCFLEYSCPGGDSSASVAKASNDRRHLCVVYGLRKFTGGLGDDDDDLVDKPAEDEAASATTAAAGEEDQLPRWANFFSKSLSEVKSVVSTAKANGEAAHLAARHINGRWLIFAGSKNVHLVFAKRSDLKLYTPGQYTVAEVVAQAVCDALDRMDKEQRLMFLSFLAHTGYTAIFELLQPAYQHVESLSYLPRPHLKFICWSSFLDSVSDTCVGALDPMLCYHMATGFGLDPVACQDVPLDQLDACLTKIRTDHGREGDVLYFLDGQRQPIGLLKRKTVWYICIRAIREKTKTALRAVERELQKRNGPQPGNVLDEKGPVMRSVTYKITNRFDQISKWLEFSESCRQKWQDLAFGFIRFVLEKTGDASLPREEVYARFPDVWERYLQVSGLTDHIDPGIPPSTAAAAVFKVPT